MIGGTRTWKVVCGGRSEEITADIALVGDSGALLFLDGKRRLLQAFASEVWDDVKLVEDKGP